jgi:hypothetical protein
MKAHPAPQPSKLAKTVKKELVSEFLNAGFNKAEAVRMAEETLLSNYQLFKA